MRRLCERSCRAHLEARCLRVRRNFSVVSWAGKWQCLPTGELVTFRLWFKIPLMLWGGYNFAQQQGVQGVQAYRGAT